MYDVVRNDPMHEGLSPPVVDLVVAASLEVLCIDLSDDPHCEGLYHRISVRPETFKSKQRIWFFLEQRLLQISSSKKKANHPVSLSYYQKSSSIDIVW